MTVTAGADVCVVGGGPAGATLAARLAVAGLHVVVVEQRSRPPVGESLSPGIWPVLDQLGVPRSAVLARGIPVTEAGVRWRGDEERVVLAEGVTVDRGAFDALLLAHARAAGVRVLRSRAGRPARVAGGWRVPVGDGTVHAAFLADASGRRRVLGGRRTRTASVTVAVHGRWRASWPGSGEQTRVEAVADGWLWGARLPGGDVRVMAFVDPEQLREERPGPLLRRLLAESVGFAPLLRAADPEPVGVCDATSSVCGPAVEADAIRVGEAAFAIDPLSSSGVQTAVQTGLAAAATVRSLVTGDGDPAAALDFYTSLVADSVSCHARTAARWYAEHRTHGAERFWRRRAGGPQAHRQPPGLPWRDLLSHRVRLRPPAAVRDTACLLGDTVGYRRALHAPDLDRPVAFLAGHELAPLLDTLAAAPSLAAALRAWEGALPRGRAAQVLAWLADRGLLEVADASSPRPHGRPDGAAAIRARSTSAEGRTT